MAKKELKEAELPCTNESCTCGDVDPHAANKPQKMSYEQLVDILNQIQHENVNLKRALQEQSMENLFMRLNYLVEIVKINAVFPSSFVQECADEIVEIISIKKDKEQE